MKLSFIDFTTLVTEKAGRHVSESNYELLERVNSWMEKINVNVINVETRSQPHEGGLLQIRVWFLLLPIKK